MGAAGAVGAAGGVAAAAAAAASCGGGGADGVVGSGRAPLAHRVWRAVAGRGGRDARRPWLAAAAGAVVLLAVVGLLDPRLVVVPANDGGHRAALTLSLSPRLSRGWGGGRGGRLPNGQVVAGGLAHVPFALHGGGGGLRGAAGGGGSATAASGRPSPPPLLALPPGAGAAGPWVFALVADMDRQSRRYDRPASAGSPSSKRWVSFLKRGLLTRLPDAPLTEGRGRGGALPAAAAVRVGGGKGGRRLTAQVGPARPAAAAAAASAADSGAAAASHAAAAAARAAGSTGRVSGAAVSARRANHTGGHGGLGGPPPPPPAPPPTPSPGLTRAPGRCCGRA